MNQERELDRLICCRMTGMLWIADIGIASTLFWRPISDARHFLQRDINLKHIANTGEDTCEGLNVKKGAALGHPLL